MSRSIPNIDRLVLVLCAAALLAAPSCKESPRVFSNDTFRAYTGNPPGYFFPFVVNTLPADGTTGVPINSSFVVVFNIPVGPNLATIGGEITITSNPTPGGLLTEGVDYTLAMNSDSTLLTVTFNYGGAYPIPENNTVSVTIGNGILSLENSVPLDNPGTWQFTTDAFPDTTAPLEATHNPTGAGISLTAPNIYIDFDEDIDPDSVNPSTLYLQDGGVAVPAVVSYDSLNRRGVLTLSVNLDPSTIYDVFATNGIEDLCGNNFAGTTWQFTTTATSLDPVPGAPAFASGPYIDTVNPDGALISWTTNKPAAYILNYGTNSDVTDVYDETLEPFPYSEYQSLYFDNPPLFDFEANTRYWFNIELHDMYGGSYTGMTTVQFNTESGETPAVVHDGAGSQYTARKLAYHPFPSGDTGFFLFWNHLPAASTQIYGQLYDSGLAPRWPDPNPVFTSGSNSYVGSTEDDMDGVIVLVLTGGNYYAKRLANDGSFHWSDTAATTGYNIGSSATISNVSAVPVHSGKVSWVTGANADLGFLGFANYFFDDDVDLSSVADNDIVYDETGQAGTTAIHTGNNFNYVVGQTDAGIVDPGDVYRIAYGGTFSDLTATDHNIENTNPPAAAVPYTSGGDHIYTPHDYSSSWPFWVNTAGGDVIRRDSDSTYALITGITTPNAIDPAGIISGTTTGGDATHLWEFGEDFSPTAEPGDFVVNDSISPNFSTIFDINYNAGIYLWNNYVELNSPAAFGAGIDYRIFDRYCTLHSGDYNQFVNFDDITMDWALDVTDTNTARIFRYAGITGTADALPANPLCDNAGGFTTIPVQIGDIVVNTDSGAAAEVGAAVTFDHALGLTADIMTDGNGYSIFRYRETPDETGRTTGAGPDIVDSTQNFLTTIAVGDIAYNPGTDLYAVVTNVVSDTQLTLDRDVGFGADFYYVVFHERGVLYVFQDASGVSGRIVSMELAAPVVRRATFTIAAGGSNPRTVSDGFGRALVIFNNSSGQVCVSLLNGYGYAVWGSDTVVDATTAEILDIQSDGSNGVVILYKRGDDLYAQRVDNDGALVWGAPLDFDGDGATTVTTQEVMEYISGDDDVIVAAKDASDRICAWRNGSTTIWSHNPLAGITGVTMQDPQIFYNTSDSTTTVIWEDDRFYNLSYVNIGYGVYGQKLSAAGAMAWFPNTGGTNDTNGISVILNHYSGTIAYWPNPLAAAHNNGTEAVILWEDYRSGLTTPDLFLMADLELFAP
ncbi:MAG: Ig-like domain-containing protein [Spirochaetes bacterium]|nr:Ig-like domain-containing protein [Spirochaetota bacterium]